MWRIILVGLTALVVSGSGASGDPAEQAGERLALELRQLIPVEPLLKRGELQIRHAEGSREAKTVMIQILPGRDGSWTNILETVMKGNQESSRLTIVHHPDRPNEYLLSKTPNAQTPFPPPAVVTDKSTAFAGSDFSLQDLGYEFLHWPGQRLLRQERRRYRLCDVLESRRPGPIDGGYARVVSWVDVESRGILRAEAYGADDKKLKEFSVGRLRQVASGIEVSEVYTVNYETDTKTTLRFRFIEY